MKLPLLPADWKAVTLSFQPPPAGQTIGRALTSILRAHGKKSFFIPFVQDYVLWANKLRAHFPFLDPVNPLLRSMNEQAWPIDDPLLEREGPGGWAPRVLDSSHALRSIQDEWDVLIHLHHRGITPVRHDRSTHTYDWLVRSDVRDIPVEVKGKADVLYSLQQLHAYVEGLCMMPEYAESRRRRWTITQNTKTGTALLNKLLPGLIDLIPDLLAELERRSSDPLPLAGSNRLLETASGPLWATMIRAGEIVEVDIASSNREFTATLQGALTQGERTYDRFRSHSDWEMDFVPASHLKLLASKLADNLVGRGKRAGKQLVEANGQWLFVLRWPVPFWWSASVCSAENFGLMLHEILAKCEEHCPTTAVAIWPVHDFLGRNRWFINGHAEVLLRDQ